MKTKRMRTAMLSLLMMMGSLTTLLAQEMKPAVVVWHNDQEIMSIYVENNPTLTFAEGQALLEAEGTYKYWFSEYEFWTEPYSYRIVLDGTTRLSLEDRPYSGYIDAENALAIDAPVATPAKPCFDIKGGQINVSGLQPGTHVLRCDLSGATLATATADKAGQARLALPHAKGTVIVKAGDVSFKILVK